MEPQPACLPPVHRDRRTGLIVFGVLEIILGAICLLSAPLMLLGAFIGAGRPEAALNLRFLPFTLGYLTAIGAGLVTLGIGSIRARRWARALLLCGGWIGLIGGVCACVILPFTLSSIDAAMAQTGQQLPASIILVVKVTTVMTTLVLYVGIPGALVLFYRSTHVKRTCEIRNPAPSWTDRCPLPVLALALLVACGGVMMLLCLAVLGGAIPVFGAFVTGVPGYLLFLACAGLAFFLARGFYRLQLAAWWIGLITLCLGASSSIVTFARIDLLDYYARLGFTPQQLEILANNPMIQQNRVIWMSLVAFVPYIGYLLFVRRYFTAARPEFTHPPAAA